MAKNWAKKLRKRIDQLAFNPFFSWFHVPDNRILSTRFATKIYLICCIYYWKEKNQCCWSFSADLTSFNPLTLVLFIALQITINQKLEIMQINSNAWLKLIFSSFFANIITLTCQLSFQNLYNTEYFITSIL